VKPRRDAATVPAASPAPSPVRPPAAPPVATPDQPEDILAKYGRLGRERAVRRRGRYAAAGFVVASGPGRAEVHQRAALRQAALQELAARGVTIESGGAVTDTRFEAFQQQQAARQYVEQAMRDQIGRRIPGKGMMR
jgi:hypothetical protein